MRRTLHEFSKTYPDKISYESKWKETYYAFSSARNLQIAPINIWSEHAENNFKDWALPDEKFGSLDIEDGKNKIILARFFGNEALRFFKKEYLIPVRELVRYLFSKFDLMGPGIKPPPPVPPVDLPIDPKDLALISQPEIGLMAKELESLAENIVRIWDSWKGFDKEIFLMKFDEDRTIKDITKSGYNSVQYWLNKATNLVQEQFNFWLSDDTDLLEHEELFKKILDEKIIFFAKKGCGTVYH
jgi:HAMP domain-containing protein